MKKLFTHGLSVVFFVLSVLVLSACGGEDDEPTPASGPVKATVNGSAWSASQVLGFTLDGELTITASDKTHAFTILVPANIKVGKFTLNTSTHFVSYMPGGTTIDPFKAVGSTKGTLEITSHDAANRKIAGKFNCSGKSLDGKFSLNVTGGTFEVTYEKK